jgi:hypothetical protein
MKPLELTKEQKDKLLEMAKVLFPEYATIEMYYDDDIADSWEEALLDKQCGNDAQVQFIIFNWHKPDAKHIHWFEFCLTYLANKIYFPDIQNIERDARNKIEKFYFSTFMEAIEGGPAGYDHPIDYLYKEFKK